MSWTRQSSPTLFKRSALWLHVKSSTHSGVWSVGSDDSSYPRWYATVLPTNEARSHRGGSDIVKAAACSDTRCSDSMARIINRIFQRSSPSRRYAGSPCAGVEVSSVVTVSDGAHRCVYKLVEVHGQARIKLSQDLEKVGC